MKNLCLYSPIPFFSEVGSINNIYKTQHTTVTQTYKPSGTYLGEDYICSGSAPLPGHKRDPWEVLCKDRGWCGSLVKPLGGAMISYMIKAQKFSCRPTKEFGETMAGGGAQLMPSPDSSQARYPRTVLGPSKGHLHKPRGAQGCTMTGRLP